MRALSTKKFSNTPIQIENLKLKIEKSKNWRAQMLWRAKILPHGR
jgi:hypothetical protein